MEPLLQGGASGPGRGKPRIPSGHAIIRETLAPLECPLRPSNPRFIVRTTALSPEPPLCRPIPRFVVRSPALASTRGFVQPDLGLAGVIFERWNTTTFGAPITLLDEQGPRQLSGSDLVGLAARYARALADLGVGRGDRVGLALPTGEDFLGAFFGAWALGAAAVPLAPMSARQDPAQEAVRLGRPLHAVGAKVAIVTQPAAELLRGASTLFPGRGVSVPAVAPEELHFPEALHAPAGLIAGAQAGLLPGAPAGSSLQAGMPAGLLDGAPAGSRPGPAMGSRSGSATGSLAGARVGSPHCSAMLIGAQAGSATGSLQDLAVVQFSSGSTGHPKGVCLSFANLLANIEAIGAVMRPQESDAGVSWLPLHHDMGLIGCLLFTQFYGIPVVLMAPEFFIRMPARWLAALSQYRATMTSAPNFAYQLCSSLPDSHVQGLDLSCMRAALVGAEPIRTSALRAFATRFAPHGFSSAAFVPTYGLAEATLAVSMTPPGEGMHTDRIDQAIYEAEHRAVPVSPEDPAGREIVGVGAPMPGLTVAILHPETGEPVAEREVGEICVAGPSVMGGYHSDPEATTGAVRNGRLRTGDLGYMSGGQLFIAGRIKDLIIKGGHKYHPQDLEAVAEEHAAVRVGGSSAFLVPRADDRDERLVLVVEIAPATGRDADVGQEIRRRVFEAAGIRVDEVVMVVPQQLPRTTSGKIRRAEARRRFLAGQLKRLDA